MRETLGPVGLAAFNAVFWPYLMLSSAVAFVPAAGLYLLSPVDKQRNLLRRWTEEWGAHYLERAPFAGVTVIGREKVDASRPCIYVANHQSMVDVLAIFAARLPALWVSKIENFYAPFLGWNMYLNGYVAVRRGYLPSIMKMRLAEGRSLIVFPEGTRSEDGKLRSFYRGAFMLAARANVPIVPIVMRGTEGVLRKGSFTVRPQQVRLEILDPIEPAAADFDSRRLRDMVRDVMAHEIERLTREQAEART
jgi:1-acyl-sn-glycerol-3-phosphate acyltransferase